MNFLKRILTSLFHKLYESKSSDQTPCNCEKHPTNLHPGLFEKMSLGVVCHDSTKKIIAANPAAAMILGLSMDQLLGRETVDPRWKAVREDGSAFPGDQHPASIAFETGKPVKDVIMGVHNPAEGRQKWIRINAFPEFSNGEDLPFQVYATFDDITEMKETQEKLTNQLKRMRRAEQVAGFGNWGFRLKEDKVYASEGAREIYGLGDREWAISEVQQLVLPEYRSMLNKALMELITNNSTYDIKFKIKRPTDGAIRDIHSIAVYEPDKSGVYGVIHDITDTVKAETALRESERKLSTLMSNLPGIAYRCRNDKNWTMEFISDGCRELTGYDPEDFIDNKTLSFNNLIHPDHRERLWKKWQEAMTMGKYAQDEYPVILPTGEEKWFWEKGCAVYSDAGEVIALEGFIADHTDLKKAESERIEFERKLLQTQKLESLGVLAGGIAHDFNNILMAVLGHADLALSELPPMSPARENISEIEKASRRAADLCRQMLAYSGKGKFIIEHIIVKDLVREMVHLLKTSISKKAMIDLNLAENAPPIKGDATQIRQVLMNLVINASEAIGDNEGIIKISTGFMECHPDHMGEVCTSNSIESGHYVWIEVSDTGCGMDEETATRMFEPFFTTKFTGRGLGMSAVMGIVQGHNGALKFMSEPGKGTTFRILFPAADDYVKKEASEESIQPLKPEGGKILLVDDEEGIRTLGRAMLIRLGFEVITASDGREAVERFSSEKTTIKVVILDLTMPRMNGYETLMELLRIDPEVKIIISSGYSEHEVVPQFSSKAIAGFIQKPYKLNTLKDCLYSAIKKD